jgi:predicted GNAT superfamily acetyltransferase
VLPAYQNKGIGRQLKLRQRDDALAKGIGLIEWTFDPLELKNAYFNLVRLGTIVPNYVRDQYGRTSSPLHAGLPTDRLVAEWWLTTPRVEAALADQPHKVSSNCQRITIPSKITELRDSDVSRAELVQAKAREQFEYWLGKGYVVTGVELDDETGSYLLEYH